METLILVFDGQSPGLAELAHDLRAVGTVQVDARQLVVERGGDRAFLRVLDDAVDEVFEDWPTESIPGDPHFLALDYRGDASARTIVCVLAATHRFLVDTNFGAVLGSGEFCRQATDASWTWERWS